MPTLNSISYNQNDIIYTYLNNQKWYVLKHICKALELKSFNTNKIPKEYLSYMYIPSKRYAQRVSIINEKGLQIMFSSTNKPKAKGLCIKLQLPLAIFQRKEVDILETISRAFHNEKSIREYSIGLYFPKYKLAVECDENNHQSYKILDEKLREIYIKEQLKCTFLRFNPDEPEFNIGEPINKILSHIVNFSSQF
jgi:very-short-patch-repair endonuclease